MQGSEAPAVKPAPVAPNVNQRSPLRMGHILTLPVNLLTRWNHTLKLVLS